MSLDKMREVEELHDTSLLGKPVQEHECNFLCTVSYNCCAVLSVSAGVCSTCTYLLMVLLEVHTVWYFSTEVYVKLACVCLRT